jgi:hypothetical protein
VKADALLPYDDGTDTEARGGFENKIHRFCEDDFNALPFQYFGDHFTNCHGRFLIAARPNG